MLQERQQQVHRLSASGTRPAVLPIASGRPERARPPPTSRAHQTHRHHIAMTLGFAQVVPRALARARFGFPHFCLLWLAWMRGQGRMSPMYPRIASWVVSMTSQRPLDEKRRSREDRGLASHSSANHRSDDLFSTARHSSRSCESSVQAVRCGALVLLFHIHSACSGGAVASPGGRRPHGAGRPGRMPSRTMRQRSAARPWGMAANGRDSEVPRLGDLQRSFTNSGSDTSVLKMHTGSGPPPERSGCGRTDNGAVNPREFHRRAHGLRPLEALCIGCR